MCDDNFLATRDCYIEPLRHSVAIMVSQIINFEKRFFLKVNLQMGVMGSDLDGGWELDTHIVYRTVHGQFQMEVIIPFPLEWGLWSEQGTGVPLCSH